MGPYGIPVIILISLVIGWCMCYFAMRRSGNIDTRPREFDPGKAGEYVSPWDEAMKYESDEGEEDADNIL